MKKTLFGVAALFAATGTSLQAADEPRIFRPASAWAADFGEDYCRLTRDFSDGEDTISLVMDRIKLGSALRVLVVGDAVKPFRGADRIGYAFLPGGDERMAMPVRGETSNGVQYYNLGDIVVGPPPKAPAPGEPPVAPAAYSRAGELDYADGVDGLMLSKGLAQPISIDTGSLKAPVEVVQSCMDDLLQYWGLDAEKHKNLQRGVFPASNMAKWVPANTISFQDFGRLAVSNNQIRVLIDAQGKVTDCQIHWPTLGENKNGTICSGVKEKGDFMPALDNKGQAIASYWTFSPFALMETLQGR